MRLARLRTPDGIRLAAEQHGSYRPLVAPPAELIPWPAGASPADLAVDCDAAPLEGELLAPVLPSKIVCVTAILVVAILAVFEPQIKAAISSALDSVTGAK